MTDRIIGPTGSKRRRRFLLGPVLLVALFALFLTSGAQAVHDLGLFQLDKDATSAAGTSNPNDWDDVFANASSNCASLPNTLACSFDADPINATIFTTGGSKDDLDTSSWRNTAGSVPDKDEIADAYSVMYRSPGNIGGASTGDQILYFGADRLAQNGSSDFGFWFFKGSVSPDTSTGLFTGLHTSGDLLILGTFTQGGAVTSIRVFKWVGTGGTCPTGIPFATANNTVCGPIGTFADCVPGSSNDNGCGTVNNTGISSPWPYTPKSGPSGTIPSGGFVEGGINLSKLGLAGCFSSFLAETRSSPSVDATLKDFVSGSFTPCKARIQISPLTATNEVGTNHVLTVTVQKLDPDTGFAYGSAGAGITVTGTITNTLGATSTFVGGNTCVTIANGTCTLTINSPTAGHTSVSASATVPLFGGGSQAVSTNGQGDNSGPAQKVWVDAKIGVSPLTDTDGITELHTITATVQQDNGTGAGFTNAPNGTTVTFSLLNNTAAATFVGGVNTCTTTSGSCSVQITSSTAGSVDVHATTTFSVGGVSLTRATGTGGNNSADAHKVFVAGTLRWLKHDQDGNPLGGATFQVCRTANFNSGTNTFDPITPVCFNDSDLPGGTTPDVKDNGLVDQDADAGELQINNLILGRYTIKETIAPDGYAPDPDTETVELTVANPSNASSPPVFVNVRQFKLIVITCRMSDNTLVVSSVTLNSVTKDTISSVPASLSGRTPAVTQSNICDIGGASYANLNAGTYNPSAVIPKP